MVVLPTGAAVVVDVVVVVVVEDVVENVAVVVKTDMVTGRDEEFVAGRAVVSPPVSVYAPNPLKSAPDPVSV